MEGSLIISVGSRFQALMALGYKEYAYVYKSKVYGFTRLVSSHINCLHVYNLSHSLGEWVWQKVGGWS